MPGAVRQSMLSILGLLVSTLIFLADNFGILSKLSIEKYASVLVSFHLQSPSIDSTSSKPFVSSAEILYLN